MLGFKGSGVKDKDKEVDHMKKSLKHRDKEIDRLRAQELKLSKQLAELESKTKKMREVSASSTKILSVDSGTPGPTRLARALSKATTQSGHGLRQKLASG